MYSLDTHYMNPQTFIFIGRSGCGKGTQAELLQKYVKEKDPAGEIFYLETGANFREFIKGSSYSSQLADRVYQTGDRQPDFLAIWMWSHVMVDSFRGTEHLFVDGTPRSLAEAMALTTAMNFYERKPVVVYLNVSRTWSEQRLLARHRADDVSADMVKKRLDWFEHDVMPAIEYFNVNDLYRLLEVNGEQSIEQVHADIVAKLGL